MTDNNNQGDTSVLDPEPERDFDADSEFFEATDDSDDESVSSQPVKTTSDDGEVAQPSTGAEGGSTEVSGTGGLELANELVEALVDVEPAVDASLAEYGTEDDIERAVAELTAEVVIGRDDRIRIHNTTSYPWRAICSLRIKANDGTNWIGTGFLVGPRIVVTAGHVVYMRKHGGWAKEIEVIPGRNGSARPYGSCKSRHFHSVSGWTRNNKRDYDYGAIVLPADCRFGDRVGHFGYANYGAWTLRSLIVNLAGYPGDKGGSTQWWHARRLTSVGSRRLRYNIDSAGGTSGGPVWRYVNGQRYVVGIHTTGHSSGNGATRINRSVFDRIKSWKTLHP